MKALWHFAFIVSYITVSIHATNTSDEKVLICYFTNWAQYRPGPGRFTPANIDPSLCTHINYAFSKIDLSSFKVLPYEWDDVQFYDQINKLKEEHPNLKTLLSVGGWNHENEPRYSKMVQTTETRKIFIDSLYENMVKYNFNGVSIDWEYPTIRPAGTPASDKHKFTLLLQEIREKLTKEARIANIEPYLLTAAVGANHTVIHDAYEIKKIRKYVDWVSLMAYDLHGSWENVTGHATAMEGPLPTVTNSLNVWLKGGMPADKLVLGVAAYGRSFTLTSKDGSLGAPVHGPGKAGTYSRTAGFLGFFEVCSQSWDSVTSWVTSKAGAPYASKDDQWVGYDSVASIKNKALLAVHNKLKGVMFWSLDLDDYSGGFCETKVKYPLLREVKKTVALAGWDV